MIEPCDTNRRNEWDFRPPSPSAAQHASTAKHSSALEARDRAVRVRGDGSAVSVLCTTIEAGGSVELVTRHAQRDCATALDEKLAHHVDLALQDLLANPHLTDVEFRERVRVHVEQLRDAARPVGTRSTETTTRTLIERTNEAIKTVVQTARLTRTLQKKSLVELKAKIGALEFDFGIHREVSQTDRRSEITLFLENRYGRFVAKREGDWFVFVSMGTPLEGCEQEFDRLRAELAAHRRGTARLSTREFLRLIERLGEINKATKYLSEGHAIGYALIDELRAREAIALPLDEYLLRIGPDGRLA